jgi:hypothetical protein
MTRHHLNWLAAWLSLGADATHSAGCTTSLDVISTSAAASSIALDRLAAADH